MPAVMFHAGANAAAMESAPFEAEKIGLAGAVKVGPVAAMESAPFEAEKIERLILDKLPVDEPQWSPLLSKRRSNSFYDNGVGIGFTPQWSPLLSKRRRNA